MSLVWRIGCEGIFLSDFMRSSDVFGRLGEDELSAPRKARVGDFVLGSEGTCASSRMLCRRLSSTPFLGKRSGSKLEANERPEEEDPGSEADAPGFGNVERDLREGTGGSSRDGGAVSGGMTTDRENDDLWESEGRSMLFRKEGLMPVLSVIPLGRVCGRGPPEPLLFDGP